MNEIQTSQQIRVNNLNFQFPGTTGYFGNLGINALQTNVGGAVPGMITAITTGQGTAVTLASLGVSAGGWVIFKNVDLANFVSWGPDDGAGNLVKQGEMLPGEIAGPFRISRSLLVERFQADTANCEIQVFIFAP